MTRPPGYIVHQVDEKDVTVDWFFTRGLSRRQVVQFVLILVGWLFAIVPVVITTSALLYRHDSGKGWWTYREGYAMWDYTTLMLEILLLVFVIGFFVLYVVNRVSDRKRDRQRTYDPARLSRRLEIAAEMYDSKFGPEDFRLERKNVVIAPYGDVETYELRDLYRTYGVDG